jgi:two-component system, sensor histidine kinase
VVKGSVAAAGAVGSRAYWRSAGADHLAVFVLDASPVAALLVALDDAVVACNAEARCRLGIGACACSGTFAELEISYRVPGLRARLEEVKASGRPARLGPVGIPVGSHEVLALVSIAPVRDAEGTVTAVLATFDDRGEIEATRQELRAARDECETASATATEELQTANEELQAAGEEIQAVNEVLRARVEELETAQRSDIRKNEFLAMLAHELRNPLAPIANALHIVGRRLDGDPTVARVVQVAQRQIKHAARILDDLLDVSRIALGKVDLRRETMDFAGVVRQAVDAAGLGATTSHQLTLDLPPEPVPVDGDPTRLDQIVRNLLSNAVKYTPVGGRIRVAVVRGDERVVLTVSDDGAGIPPDVLPRVFDLFAQADSTLARSQGGLGIGLTLVRRLVELHGGTVSARSDGDQRGSEFEVSLPLGGNAGVTAPSSRAPVKSRRILLVEDSADAREMLRVSLELEGHYVYEASDGPAGVAAAARLAPDIVLVDIGLPGIDGYEVARRIRKRLGRATRLVALTGYGDAQSRLRAIEAGFDAHVVKPAGVEDLNAALGLA